MMQGIGQGSSILLIRDFLLYSLIINTGFLLFTGIGLFLFRKTVYRVHGKIFNFNEFTFNAFYYGFIGFYKILVIFFNLVPLAVIQFMI